MQSTTKSAFSAMRRILRSAESQARSLMARTGLTPAQLVLLQQLEGGAERTASDLAHRLGITQATATVMIKKLEARGLLRRRPGAADRRQTWLSLSEAGDQALHIAPDGIQAKFAAEFDKLKDWEQQMIIASLMRVADMLDAEADAAPLIDSNPDLGAARPQTPGPSTDG